jgi:preprotein translocase subunit SecD
VRVEGEWIAVERPLRRKPDARAERLLLEGAHLAFHVVDDGSAYMQRLADHARTDASRPPSLEAEHDQWSERATGAMHLDEYLRARDRETLERYLAALPTALQPPPDRLLLVEELSGGEDSPAGWRTHYVHRREGMEGDSISDAEMSIDQQTLRPEVLLSLDAPGAFRFERLTARSVGRKLAIVLDGTVTSAPVIESRIAGGRVRITLGGMSSVERSREEAIDLVAVLRSGGLIAPLHPIDDPVPAKPTE